MSGFESLEVSQIFNMVAIFRISNEDVFRSTNQNAAFYHVMITWSGKRRASVVASVVVSVCRGGGKCRHLNVSIYCPSGPS